jgi:hypothetical protein
MRIVIAFRAFFAALFNRDASMRILQALDPSTKLLAEVKTPQANTASTATTLTTSPAQPSSANSEIKKPARSEALTLLSTLQREARLIDLIEEPLDEYTDDQVGSAARDVLRESSKVLNRLFAIEKLAQGNEGDSVEIPSNASSAKWKITGKPTRSATNDPTAPRRGNLIHPGWIATQVAVPQWSGNSDEATVIAPAEAELI